MSPRQPLVFVTLLVMIFTEACNGIGSWGKKSATTETENAKDASGSNSDMEKTYLDLFGESAKEFLTQKAPEKIKTIIPATDEECRWDWRYVRCEPYCECSFQPKLPGDFHLGRACRKRSHLGGKIIDDQSGNEKAEDLPLEETDDTYREYCVVNSGDFGSTPPPPSIPSPFPFLEKSGKATWNILRTKADPIVAKAVDEFETMHGKVQAVVCQDLKTRCDDSQTSQGDMEPTEVAWQERLFCRNVVRGCKEGSALQKEQRNDRNA